MYYVLFVRAGKESQIESYIHTFVPKEYYTDCFHPMRHMRKKLRGEWKDTYKRLLPGYVFVESDRIESFRMEAMKIPSFLKILGMEREDEELSVQALSEEETEWLRKMMTGKTATGAMKHIVELSQIDFDENDKISIVDGPLKDLQGQIKKIHLHKRIAEVELEFLGRKTVFHLGIEVLKKEEA